MDGPRPVRLTEMQSLARLVDEVFGRRSDGAMPRSFPQLFCEANIENLMVYADDGHIVSHVGMTERWACLAGCTVGVACIGSVATYEAHRGQGLATRLLEATCAKAVQDGIDFMLISGGRGLYRRAGAADVGYDFELTVSVDSVADLAWPGLEVTDFLEEDLECCIAAYNAKPAHFLRPKEDWTMFLECRSCMCADTQFEIIRSGGLFAGYYVPVRNAEDESVRILEFAGEPGAIVAGLGALMRKYDARCARIHLQAGDVILRAMLEKAGAGAVEVDSSGTLLLLDFDRLMRRLGPYFEQQIGREEASRLSFSQQDETYHFGTDGETHVVEGKMAAAELIFGNRRQQPPPAALEALFPVPGLWYGLNYV